MTPEVFMAYSIGVCFAGMGIAFLILAFKA